MIHISGAGLLGSFVMRSLADAGQQFTWSDNDSPAAWVASTGAVIPCEDRDLELYAQGYRWWRDRAVQRPYVAPHLEPVETIYVMKNPPSRVSRKWKPEIVGANRVWREELPGWQFDVGGFIAATRLAFSAQRVHADENAKVVLRARGVMEPVNRPTVVWGWRCSVTIRPTTAGAPLWSRSGLRPVIHFNDPQRGYERYYFHPLAGHPNTWWAGSEAVLQREPTRADARAAIGLRRYQETVQRRFGGLLEVEYGQELTQGWRAKPRKVHKDMLLPGFAYQTSPGVFIAMPLYKSGVQCGPMYGDVIAEQLIRVNQ